MADCLNHPYVKMWFTEEEVNQPASPSHYDEEVEVQDKSLQEWKGGHPLGQLIKEHLELLFDELRRFQRTRSSSRSTVV